MNQEQWPRGGKKALLEPIRFGDFLRERNAISDEQLLDALADHWAHGERIGDTVTRRGFLPQAEVERLANEYHHDLSIVEVEVPIELSVPVRRPVG
jgi:hypothetical protein